jgi:hypothetical protein
MRRLFYLLIGLLILTACGSNETTNSPAVISGDTSPYQLLISSSDLVPSKNRLVLTLWDGPQRLTDAQALEIELYAINQEGEAQDKIWAAPAQSYEMDGLQYWVSYPDFPTAGNYGVVALVTNKEGKQVENRAILTVKEQADAPAIGELPPRSNTRTLTDAPIEELTSAGPYVEGFYQMSIAEAVESDKPAIIAFVTPAFCTSALCAPVMQTLSSLSDELTDKINIVHIEIWRDFANEEVEPAVEEWNLPSEPWLFILNSDGTIGARLDGPVSPVELREVLAEVIG